MARPGRPTISVSAVGANYGGQCSPWPTGLDGYVKKSGDIMNGSLMLFRDPVQDMEAANKRYVDGVVGGGVVGPPGPPGPQGPPGTPFPEAPIDGFQYARQNANWAVVAAVPEAPTDGQQYARVLAAWAVVAQPADAPSDGQQYARENATWVVVAQPIDAPSDGLQYARQNAAWAVVAPALGEAPLDGFIYGRQSAAWAVALGDAPNDGLIYARRSAAWIPVTELPPPGLPGEALTLDIARAPVWGGFISCGSF